jgi:flagellar basal body rod protein FlgB
MKKVLAMLSVGLESSSVKTPEFKALASAFKSALKKELQSIGATLEAYHVNHFDVSGFFKKGEQLYYFSFGDVRGMEFAIAQGRKVQMMYRTAQHLKDWKGGGNQWVDIEEGMAEKMHLN